MMCLGCGEEEDDPKCAYCGITCYGTCNDPDRCPTCFLDDFLMIDFESGEDEVEACLEAGCECYCHKRLAEHEAAFRKKEAERDGEVMPEQVPADDSIFPFLKLPCELRDQIYRYAITQEGEQRISSKYHRGTIHTAIVKTCRTIYNEAGHYPLTLNRLDFERPLYAVNYIGYCLSPVTRPLFTKFNVETEWNAVHGDPTWQMMMKALSPLPVTDIGLVLKGPITEEMIIGHSCLTDRFKSLRHLEAFDVTIGSALCDEDAQREIKEFINWQLFPSKARKSSSRKRRKTAESAGKKLPGKKSKQPQTKQISKKSGTTRSNTRLNDMQSGKLRDEFISKQNLTAIFNKLKTFATAVNISLVRLRLESLKKLVDKNDTKGFNTLYLDIMTTLDEENSNITAARKDLPITLPGCL